MVGAGAHASIYPDPTMYDATFSNNTKINLLFNVRTFGNDMERYEIRIFKGSTESSANLVARKNADFDKMCIRDRACARAGDSIFDDCKGSV